MIGGGGPGHKFQVAPHSLPPPSLRGEKKPLKNYASEFLPLVSPGQNYHKELRVCVGLN